MIPTPSNCKATRFQLHVSAPFFLIKLPSCRYLQKTMEKRAKSNERVQIQDDVL